MKYKRLFILIFLITILVCHISMAQDSSYVNLELLSRIYNVTRERFIGDFNRGHLFNGAFEKVEIYLKEKGIETELEEFQATEDEDEDLSLFLEVIDEISSRYNTNEVTKGDIIREAIDGLLEALDDPYTYYMSPQEFKEFMATLNIEEYSGIGVYVELDKKNENKLTLLEVFEEGPAGNAGLKAGDIIIEIDGRSTDGMTMEEGTGLIRGPQGSEINLTIERTEEIIEFSFLRDKITVKNILFKLTDDGIGYIKIRTFGENTAEELEEALEELNKHNVRAYIIDLRNNGGGLIETAIDICSKFLPEESPVVTVKEKENFPVKYKSEGAGNIEMPLVVLVNEFSASASEITAGAMKDNKRGIIMGTKTFGKGSVQTIYPLGISGVLKITNAHYFTPSDRNIDKEGLMPDIEVEMEGYPSGLEEEDIQFQKALDYLREKIGP